MLHDLRVITKKSDISKIDFKGFKNHVKINVSILSDKNINIYAKYVYFMSNSMLNILKSARVIKNHSLYVPKYLLMKYIINVAYSNLGNNEISAIAEYFEKYWTAFINSDLCVYYNQKEEYVKIKPWKQAVFIDKNIELSNSVIIGGEDLKQLALRKFMRLFVHILYSSPQMVDKDSLEHPIMSQKLVSKYLGIEQGVVSAMVQDMNKVYVYELLTEDEYKSLKFKNHTTKSFSQIIKVPDPDHLRILHTVNIKDKINPVIKSKERNEFCKEFSDKLQSYDFGYYYSKPKYNLNKFTKLSIDTKKTGTYINYISDVAKFVDNEIYDIVGYLSNNGIFWDSKIQYPKYKYYYLRGTKGISKYKFFSETYDYRTRKHKTHRRLINTH